MFTTSRRFVGPEGRSEMGAPFFMYEQQGHRALAPEE